jgi:hypothetical protein
VLINSVLNAIPIFFLSFLKMPRSVVKAVVRIQRNFLWGGVKGDKKMCWISWGTVCKDKKDGGLGVRDIKVVNVSLLSKWRWNLLNDEPTLWKEVLIAKYGGRVGRSVSLNGCAGGRFVSAWWKDLCDIEDFIPAKCWFENAIERRVLNGASTLFWSQRWVGESTLEMSFPRLYSLSVHKEANVSELAVIGDDNIVWNLNWRRVLFAWEEILVHDLRALLSQVKLSAGNDSWWWKADPEGLFSVRSAYSLLFSEVSGAVEVVGRVNPVFEWIWKSPAPSKLIHYKKTSFF